MIYEQETWVGRASVKQRGGWKPDVGPSAPRPQSEQHKEAVRGGRRWRGETGGAHVTEGTHRERTGWEGEPAGRH